MASREQRLAIVVVAKDLASGTLRGINGELARLGGTRGGLAQATRGMGTLGAGIARVGVVAGAAAIGGLVAAAKAGIDFQDAWAGVVKTVGDRATTAELDALYASLRQLAMRIPVKFTDLALIAQEAGALGVAAKDVAAFTEAVARTSAATVGLTTEAASAAFGKLGTLFDLHGGDFEKLGSVLVDLGNNAASTEGDIVAVGLRFGGVGRAAGLSIPQILAWSSTIASLGPLAEAGGSSLGRMFTRVIQYAGIGDGKLKVFAKTAGMTFEEFQQLVKTDTNTAFLKFIEGLKGLGKLELGATLKEAGITNVRDIQSIQAFLLRTDLLTDSLARADKQWQTHNALLEVSSKRFDTLKAHLTEFKNAILDAAVTVSEGMNPAIDRALQKLRAFLLLPGTQSDLKNLGKDIGEAIDAINWAQVLSGAKSLISYAKTFLDIIRQIPPEITAGIVGFAAVNKVSGGLIGAGISDIVSGSIKTLFSQFFARGSSPANPLYVTMGGPGLPGGPGGKPGGPGVGAGTAGAGIAISIPEMNKIVRDNLAANGITPNGSGSILQDSSGGEKASTLTPAEWQKAIKAAMPPGFGANTGRRDQNAPDKVVNAIREQNRGTDRLGAIVKGGLDALHADLLANLAVLRTSKDPAALAAAAKAVADSYAKGAGNVGTTQSLAAELRAKAAEATAAGNKDLAAAFTAAAARIERKLPGREWIAEQKAAANKIADSNKSVADKVRELKAIQQNLIAHGDTAAARIVGALINSVVPAINAINIRVGANAALPGVLPPSPRRRGETSTYHDAGGGLRVGGRATGGPVARRKTYIVGENGPELFRPESQGRIVKAADRRNQTDTIDHQVLPRPPADERQGRPEPGAPRRGWRPAASVPPHIFDVAYGGLGFRRRQSSESDTIDHQQLPRPPADERQGRPEAGAPRRGWRPAAMTPPQHIPVNLHVRTTVTHRDVKLAEVRQARLGPTAASAGAR